jgi:hypothetical protein
MDLVVPCPRQAPQQIVVQKELSPLRFRGQLQIPHFISTTLVDEWKLTANSQFRGPWHLPVRRLPVRLLQNCLAASLCQEPPLQDVLQLHR